MARPKLNEETLSEMPAIEQLQKMGYAYIPGEKLDPQENEDSERARRAEVILVSRLRRKLAELNPEATPETIEKAIRQYVTNIQGTGLLDENKNFYKNLVSQQVSIEQDVGGRRRNVTIRFVDFETPENNEFLAVNQFWVKGPKGHAKPDIVLFINGIPVVVIECKSPVAKDTGVSDAVSQLLRYQTEIPALFRANQILMGVNLFGAKYGVVGAAPQDFHEWKEKNGEKFPLMKVGARHAVPLALGKINKDDLTDTPASQDVLIASLLKKENLLDIIRNFIVFDVEEGKAKKKICRYPQFTAAQKIVKRVLYEPEKKGIIWHWQGSGKSLTMLFTALKLKREQKRLKNPYILIVTDRKDLDRQIKDTFLNCDFPNPVKAESKNDLYELLRRGVGQTIMTTVQKFREFVDEPLTDSENVIVLTDEAHRTQYGRFGYILKKALPNAAFFAFTGTPLNKKDRNTYLHFSPENESYLDRYSIQQAEEDKATVPIKYVSRMAQLHVTGASLDAMIRGLFPEKSAKELAEIKKKYATADMLARAPQRIEKITLDILKHYNEHVKPNGLKAMVVTDEKIVTDLYKQTFDRLAGENVSEVVMTVDNNDPEEWKEKYDLSEQDEKNIKERFEDAKSRLSFLIVCDKLLTGFDAPNLQAMYLDKRLREHTLLQAVARTNRNYPRKNFGLIMDYVGIGTELADAVAMFSEDVAGLFRLDDVEREFENLKRHHRDAMDFFKDAAREGKDARVVLQEYMQRLADEKMRQKFNGVFRAFAKSLDFLMPDTRIDAECLRDFQFLSKVREGAKNLYHDGRLCMDDVSPKIESLIHAHIAAEGVEELLAPITISAPDFQEKLNAKGDDKMKAAYLTYALDEQIQSRAEEDRAFYGSLENRLKELIEQQKKERVDDAELFRGLMRIKEDEGQRDKFAKELGLDGKKELAFYDTIKTHKDKLPQLKKDEWISLSKEIISIVAERVVAEWTERDDVQKEMRREIKRLLRKKGVEEGLLPPLVRELMELAQVWMKK